MCLPWGAACVLACIWLLVMGLVAICLVRLQCRSACAVASVPDEVALKFCFCTMDTRQGTTLLPRVFLSAKTMGKVRIVSRRFHARKAESSVLGAEKTVRDPMSVEDEGDGDFSRRLREESSSVVTNVWHDAEAANLGILAVSLLGMCRSARFGPCHRTRSVMSQPVVTDADWLEEAPSECAMMLGAQCDMLSLEGMTGRQHIPDMCRQRRLGDGNCFWRSVAAAMTPRRSKRKLGWKQLKGRVRDAVIATKMHGEEKDQVMKALAPNAWVTTRVVEIAVQVLQLDLMTAAWRPFGWC
eukprot:6019727-Amphidinium_carterae.1